MYPAHASPAQAQFAVIADPVAMVQNTVLFPLGLTRQLSPAQSMTPGDLLARTAAAPALTLDADRDP